MRAIAALRSEHARTSVRAPLGALPRGFRPLYGVATAGAHAALHG